MTKWWPTGPFDETTVELDDELVTTAREYCRKTSLSALLNEALKALIHMEASQPSGVRCPI
jgi:Arc/MetJ family transcription regulator